MMVRKNATEYLCRKQPHVWRDCDGDATGGEQRITAGRRHRHRLHLSSHPVRVTRPHTPIALASTVPLHPIREDAILHLPFTRTDANACRLITGRHGTIKISASELDVMPSRLHGQRAVQLMRQRRRRRRYAAISVNGWWIGRHGSAGLHEHRSSSRLRVKKILFAACLVHNNLQVLGGVWFLMYFEKFNTAEYNINLIINLC
jgi:hypothetical protein